MLQGEDCHLALLMTMCQYWHKLKRPWRMTRQALPPPRPGGKDCPKRYWKRQCCRWACAGGGREPLQVIAVLTQVWVLLGFSVSSRKAASGRVQPSVQVRLSVTQDGGPRGRAGGTSDHFHPSTMTGGRDISTG